MRAQYTKPMPADSCRDKSIKILFFVAAQAVERSALLICSCVEFSKRIYTPAAHKLRNHIWSKLSISLSIHILHSEAPFKSFGSSKNTRGKQYVVQNAITNYKFPIDEINRSAAHTKWVKEKSGFNAHLRPDTARLCQSSKKLPFPKRTESPLEWKTRGGGCK